MLASTQKGGPIRNAKNGKKRANDVLQFLPQDPGRAKRGNLYSLLIALIFAPCSSCDRDLRIQPLCLLSGAVGKANSTQFI